MNQLFQKTFQKNYSKIINFLIFEKYSIADIRNEKNLQITFNK